MELFSAFLTGFFFWLFVAYCLWNPRIHARKTAGSLLLAVALPIRARRISYVSGMANGLLLMILAVACFGVRRTGSNILESLHAGVSGFLLFLGLYLVIPFPYRRIGFEAREHGIVCALQSKALFLPWGDIPWCAWDGWGEKVMFRCHPTAVECAAAAEQIDGIVATLGQFVRITDVAGKVLAAPAESRTSPEWKQRRLFRFQFDLRSIFMLTLVLSSLFSCIGTHYRRLQLQRESVARLKTFNARLDHNGDDPYSVSFFACKVKPGDSDLICLQGLRRLRDLNLDGSPISDAGLKHLCAITTLEHVSLWNTQVTRAGVDELQRALPNAYIRWSNGSDGGTSPPPSTPP